MLNPYRLINVKLLVGFLVFLGLKSITLKNMGRGGGGFLSYSLPNHDAKGWKGKVETKTKKNQGMTTLERVRAQKSQ